MSGIEAALVSGLLKVAGNKLGSLVSSEFAAITGMKKDLSELQDKHGEITSWLYMVHDRAIESDPSIQWVMKMRSLTNDIYDLLDEVQIEHEKHRINSSHDKHRIIDFLLAKPRLFMFRCKVAHKIKEINVTFNTIVKQRSNANTILLNFQVDQPVKCKNKAIREQSLLSNVPASKIPSRDRVKSEIVYKLVESSKGEDRCIVSIVGLGGSGKTTLAQQICHDDKIKEHFKDTIFWVHISQEFCRDKLIGKLFEAIIEKKSDLHALQHMLHAISNKLSGKKFLLVLDDACHEDMHDWENFLLVLNSTASGSKILLTTRNQNVAKAVDSKHIFNLVSLLEDESWNFFLKCSGLIEEDLGSDFIDVGKDIVKKCGGVPLAIKTLGSILHERRGINTWMAIRDSNLWNEVTIEGRVFASLKLSYIYLDDHVKQCFTYCSIFPKGYKINKDYLVEQWMAHGFIKVKNELLAEDIGNEYFDSLMKVGFLQDPIKTRRENSVVCKMHDLIHDLTQYISQNEVVTLPPKNMTIDCSQKCRYLSLTASSEKVMWGPFKKVRAIHVSGGNRYFGNLVKKSFCIRSVVIDCAIDTQFPLFILKLEHLGYLEVHHVSCTKLPEAISGCWNLQSLNIINCKGFVTLPKSIGKLRRLRTLELNYVTDLEILPESIGNCQDLQTLKLNYCEKLREIPSSIGGMGNLRVLQIVSCSSLQQLPLEFNGDFPNLETVNLEGCLGLQDLPRTFTGHKLHTLNLSQTKVTMLPQWVTSLGTLKCIELRDCNELLELPKGVANLKNLVVLNIMGCNKLQCMPSGFGQLTRLRNLGLFVVGCSGDDARISELENIDMINFGRMAITNLKYLKDPSDAEKAMLKRKNIWSLELDWSLTQTEEELVSDMEQDWGVLNALEPPSKISYLKICGYRGPYLPHWMMRQNYSCCSRIMFKQTGTCQFLSLTEMRLAEFPNLKHIQGVLEFPSLKSLHLLEMPNLEELWTTTSGFEVQGGEFGAQYCFPVLSELFIIGCPKLNVKPCLPPSLVTGAFSHPLPPPVDESSSSRSVHSAVQHLKEPQLTDMMGSSSSLELLQHHTELEILHIERCNDLTELPEDIRKLTSLQKLHISECYNLRGLPEWLGELRSLRCMNVSVTPLIDSLPQSTKHLTSLVTLNIFRWDNLKQLPEVIQHLTSLECLNLGLCDELTVLPEWIGQLSALRSLYIQFCPALECLPQSIQRLTALQHLQIRYCPELTRRYKQGVGSDWQLLSHIPKLEIHDY